MKNSFFTAKVNKKKEQVMQRNIEQQKHAKYEKFRNKLVTVLSRLNEDKKTSLLQKKIKQEDIYGINLYVDDQYVDKLVSGYTLKDTDLIEPCPGFLFDESMGFQTKNKLKNELPRQVLKVEKNILNHYDKKSLDTVLKSNEVTRQIKHAKARLSKRHFVKIQNRIKQQHFNSVSLFKLNLNFIIERKNSQQQS